MKPDWKDAPSWANWLAMDFRCVWYWHECEPFLEDYEWDSAKRVQRASVTPPIWTRSKERRP